MADLLVRGFDRAAALRVVSAITTDLVREAVGRHAAEGLGACALGRALTSSLLLATMTKGGERVTLQLEGDGPLGGATIDADNSGSVRGYLAYPERARELCLGRGRVVDVLGRHGVVNVLRDLGLKERYQGQIPLTTGEIDEDVEAYLRQSEQIPSALGCDVFFEGTEIMAAGGLLVQSLPAELSGSGAEEEARAQAKLRQAQHALRSGQLWDQLVAGQRSARELAEAVYGPSIEFLDERPLRFQCRCSTERAEQSLALLSTVDLDEMIAEQGEAEVTCNFCNMKYCVPAERLEEIRQEVARGPRVRN